MGFETILFAFLPMAVAVIAGAASVRSLGRRPSVLQGVCALVVLPLLGFSLVMLAAMVGGAWASFLPHVLIAAAALVVAFQLAHASRRRDRARPDSP